MKKKRNNRSGNQPSGTKIAGDVRVRPIRCRGGNIKKRALRLIQGTFELLTNGREYTTDLIQVVYNPTSNELVRTNTLTKSSVVVVDAKPFEADLKTVEGIKEDKELQEILEKGHLYARITSRPGQMGEAKGYVLMGEELAFYTEKFKKKNKSA